MRNAIKRFALLIYLKMKILFFIVSMESGTIGGKFRNFITGEVPVV